MKAIMLTVTVVGAAIAGIILYYRRNPEPPRNSGSIVPMDERVDGQLRQMKYSMG
jgi:hypothetical protein